LNNQNQKMIKGALVLFVILLVINFSSILNNQKKEEKPADVDYSAFLQDVNKNNIASVTIVEKLMGPRELKVTPKEGAEFTFNPPHDPTLVKQLVDNKVKLKTEKEPGPSWFSQFFFSWGPTIFFLIVWIWIMKKMSGGGGKGGLFSFNKSKAQLINPDDIKVTFNDVVGCDEAKHEIHEFIDFLKNPDKFSKLGGRIPRGVLLTGPAGTGKTLLAKALAKESGVPFFAMSGSDFVEMFVGVGASRVRDMFETAKKHSPCVLFIDEIDTIGGKRGSGNFGGGGHDEREQTLNQILVELDGIDTNKGVILVGATNRPETLDPALLRPGRIDRQITVNLPDVNGRTEILKIHSKEVPLSNNVNLNKIARGTPGFSGAELANLINESAIFAARRSSKFVEQVDLEKAKDKIMMGVERPSLAMSEEDKRETAYHESGHAVVAKLIKNADPVYKVTIIPRGRALGVTMQLPEKDRWSYKKQFLLDRIAILMGGRAAEEIFCHTMTNGASNDIAVSTSTARSMVMEWGMSSLGPIAYGDRQQTFLGSGGINASGISPDTLKEVDMEVRRMIEEQYDRAKQLLLQYSDRVEAMTAALMEIETLEDWQIENIMNGYHYNDNAALHVHHHTTEEATIVDGSNVYQVTPAKEFKADTLDNTPTNQ
jgi:cell division protease FtsH